MSHTIHSHVHMCFFLLTDRSSTTSASQQRGKQPFSLTPQYSRMKIRHDGYSLLLHYQMCVVYHYHEQWTTLWILLLAYGIVLIWMSLWSSSIDCHWLVDVSSIKSILQFLYPKLSLSPSLSVNSLNSLHHFLDNKPKKLKQYHVVTLLSITGRN